MAANLIDIKAGLVTALETIPGMEGKVYDYIPGTQDPPSITIVPGTFIPGDTKAAIQYDSKFARGSDDFVFTLMVVVSRAVDSLVTDDLDKYLAGSGTHSIRECLANNETLASLVSFAKADRVLQYGVCTWNGLSFFGAQVIVEVCG